MVGIFNDAKVSDVGTHQVLRFVLSVGGIMVGESDNEIVVGHVVYAFTSAGMAKAFQACLNTGTLSTCKGNWQPTGIYPPVVLDIKAF